MSSKYRLASFAVSALCVLFMTVNLQASTVETKPPVTVLATTVVPTGGPGLLGQYRGVVHPVRPGPGCAGSRHARADP